MQTYFEEALHYGLLLGAVIQLVAIASIFLLNSPPKPESKEESEQQSMGVQPSSSQSSNVIDKSKKTVSKGSRKRKK